VAARAGGGSSDRGAHGSPCKAGVHEVGARRGGACVRRIDSRRENGKQPSKDKERTQPTISTTEVQPFNSPTRGAHAPPKIKKSLNTRPTTTQNQYRMCIIWSEHSWLPSGREYIYYYMCTFMRFDTGETVALIEHTINSVPKILSYDPSLRPKMCIGRVCYGQHRKQLSHWEADVSLMRLNLRVH
jgi:hypothetical protein